MTGPSPDVAATVEAARSILDGLPGYVDTFDGERRMGAVSVAAYVRVVLETALVLAETRRPAEPEQVDVDYGYYSGDMGRINVARPNEPNPTEPEQDDREALADLIALSLLQASDGSVRIHDQHAREVADAVLAAGFTRAPQPERAARDHGLRVGGAS